MGEPGETVRRATRLAAAALFVAGVGAFVSAAPDPAAVPADLVLRGGQVYTLDAPRRWAESIAIRNGRIVSVGSDAEVAAHVGAGTRIVELAGRMVLPGFHDSHVHPLAGGVELGQCSLSGLATPEAVFAKIGACAAALPAAAWLVGSGFELTMFPGGNPRREDLDRVVSDRPAVFSSTDGHSSWVNSQALAIAGVTRDTPDPPGGRIERDETGTPSGTLRESAAALVGSHVPPITPAERRAGLRRGLEMAARLGITSFIEASADEAELGTYEEAAREGWLGARVTVSQRLDAAAGEGAVPALAARARRAAGPRLRADSAKLFVDGVIEGGTAALDEPYAGRGEDRGELLFEPAALARLAVALARERLQLHAHAIGDRAIRVTLDAIEAARAATGWTDARPHLAHIQLLPPAQIARFRGLGAAANVQALWAYEDPFITDLTVPRLGADRSRWLYPIGSLLAGGAVVVGGSDWSVTSMNPLQAIEVGLTRRAPGSGPGPAWIPEERATLSAMLAAYTINGAWLQRAEAERGSIEVGKLADLVVLERNLFDVPPHEISRVKVVKTLLEGKDRF
jgi:predicted amidohydrolase YtcJ